MIGDAADIANTPVSLIAMSTLPGSPSLDRESHGLAHVAA